MKGLVIGVLSLLLLSGCAHKPAGTPTGISSTPTPTPVKSLVANSQLPFDDAGRLRLLGVCWGYASIGDPSELSRFDVTLPAKIDGVSTEVAFPLRVDDSSTIRDNKGLSLSRHELCLALDRDTYGESKWAATAGRRGTGLLALDLAVVGAESPRPAETTAKVLRSLALEGVLPFGSDDTFDLTGDITGGEGAGSAQGMKLTALAFGVPMRIDGVDADVTLRVVVDDQSRMYDEKGEIVPRLEQERYEDSHYRPWTATVRKQGDELVALELRVLTTGT